VPIAYLLDAKRRQSRRIQLLSNLGDLEGREQ
jgi:hypothetical protein